MHFFLVINTYVKPLDDVDRVLPEHRLYLEERYAEGTFLVSGRLVPRTGGVVLARAESREALEAALAGDPFRREGICEYQIFEFEVTKQSEAWERFAAYLR